MDCTTTIFFSTLRRRVETLINLEENAHALALEMGELREMADDLNREVEMLERKPRMKRTSLVAAWLSRVDELNTEVDAFLSKLENGTTCLGSCSLLSLRSNWELGMEVVDLLVKARELKGQSDLAREFVGVMPPDAVVSVPSTKSIVGRVQEFEAIRDHIRSEGAGIIGIVGMGGVGKTTLLALINNSFLQNPNNDDFDMVIWVTVSSDVDIFQIQEVISARLGYVRHGEGQGPVFPTDEKLRVTTLYSSLRAMRFLLLLDDIWEPLDLAKIGIPLPNDHQNRGKIVFTTRSSHVVSDMYADQIYPLCLLSSHDSWELFSQKVGAKVDLESPSIQRLAMHVVHECCGLPLALVTLGRAMANATKVDDWKHAMMSLSKSPDAVQGMKTEVFSTLKFSFDKLENDLRECLVYCALFPEDCDIDTDKLTDYWVGEGFLEIEFPGSLDIARGGGREIIKKLTDACLLESGGTGYERSHVRMHSLVRATALWLMRVEGDKFLVYPGSDKEWEAAERISLINNKDVILPSKPPKCSKLLTLLMNGTNIAKLIKQDSFTFKFMRALRVLDLSAASIEDLPEEIGLLIELRYLNLSETKIRSLPKELGNLSKLIYLNLRDTSSLEKIPREAIVNLSSLRMLNLFASSYDVAGESSEYSEGDRKLSLWDIEVTLYKLEELGLYIRHASLATLVRSNKLSKCTNRLKLEGEVSGPTAAHLSGTFKRFKKLRELYISDYPKLEELRFDRNSRLGSLESLVLSGIHRARIVVEIPIQRGISGRGSLLPFQSLHHLSIWKCHGFADLTWVVRIPNLEKLYLHACGGIVELLVSIEEEEGETSSTDDCPLPRLRRMTLANLPRLRSINRHTMLLPSLESLRVMGCSRLKKLPVDGHSAEKLREIRGEQEWWDGLEWDDENNRIKSKFRHSMYVDDADDEEADMDPYKNDDEDGEDEDEDENDEEHVTE